ncbi:MAG: trypsin-like peptidase domain-containing protein, partial [Bacteroidales bacterium]|nr:trypsin-like peptidase domain-containing protein [Bacteroidales bacterium]
MASIRAEDDTDEKQALPRRVAVAVDANLDLMDQTSWQSLPDGSWIKQWRISCDGALALSLDFDVFRMVPGAKLFVYDDDRQYLLGAFTTANNRQGGLFATGLVPGDGVIIEINADPAMTEEPVLHLSAISYLYRDLPNFLDSRGPSDHCEVNINCPEGVNWQKQKQGVTRIYVKKISSYFWCTGSLVNNTRKDLAPFLLTADHCAPNVSASDLSQWVFYFNFEAPGCENPATTPPAVSLTGAVKLAGANTSGSDFLLLRLEDDVPENYNPYYNGWSRENIPSPNGVTIHHPNGDIKKISTYTQTLISSQWSGTPGTHWLVYWSPTVTNWGVTEGGSSGSPLFDNNGRIIGTLTGGTAACDPGGIGPGSGPDQPDYYGKFSWSWDQNGTESDQQLKPWLDPDNTGILSLPGLSSTLSAALEASDRVILSGGNLTCRDISSGLPV